MHSTKLKYSQGESLQIDIVVRKSERKINHLLSDEKQEMKRAFSFYKSCSFLTLVLLIGYRVRKEKHELMWSGKLACLHQVSINQKCRFQLPGTTKHLLQDSWAAIETLFRQRSLKRSLKKKRKIFFSLLWILNEHHGLITLRMKILACLKAFLRVSKQCDVN